MGKVTEIVIWAQSMCRSTMALYREMKRQATIRVTVVLRQGENAENVLRLRECQGQAHKEYSDVVDVIWDGSPDSAAEILAGCSSAGTVHVFSGYQVSEAIRGLILEARARGCGVTVYDEAPCEMCVGVKAVLKRQYYRWVLPGKVCNAVNASDRFLNASGESGVDRLKTLGWDESKIEPLGYVSPVEGLFTEKVAVKGDRALRVLHTGSEDEYRDVDTLKRAVKKLESKGVEVELVCTGGKVSVPELAELYKWADVFVGCGLCEPWGMRVNDAIHAGVPVVVSDGMGAKMLVERFGCGCVYGRGCEEELVVILERFAADQEFRVHLISGVKAAHEVWRPEVQANILLEVLSR